ncbi:MAG TPA: 2-amino-4-hydroxy-6-hydroxymethyldihydropteridine diphosphokinase [Bacteroidales bacterium]|nr:2-amino-4-hydroxy-6-hydroxymethyldihydropteridine diphosphokinase [Bacteroidales bacterium]
MARIYLGLGSNLGDKEANLKQAIKYIEKQIGPIVALSVFFVSEPWGFESKNHFLNACVAAETMINPKRCLSAIKAIEASLGRPKKTSGPYMDRVIDLDILFYDDLVLEGPELVIPHPLLHQRRFVLKPLMEIAPNLVHPVLGKTISELLFDLNEQS